MLEWFLQTEGIFYIDPKGTFIMNTPEKIWLLRINETVYGPFNKDKIIDLITKGRVSEIDEAALPRGRWSYVRDCQEFMGALELQGKIQSRKSGSTSSTGGTETEALSADESDQTKELTSANQLTKTAPIPKIKSEDLKLAQGGKYRRSAHMENKPNFPSSNNSKKSNWKALFLFFLVMLSAGGYYFFKYSDQKSFFSDILKKEFKHSFIVSWKNGDYKNAYESIQTKDSLIDNYKIEHASLILINEQNGQKARKGLDKISNKSDVKWKMLSGLAYLYEDELDKAESELKAVGGQGNEWELVSLYNLGVLHYLKKDWSQAKIYFEAVFSRQKNNEFQSAGLLLLDSWIQDSMSKQNLSSDSESLSKFVANLYSSSSLYKYELYFIALWLDEVFGTSITANDEFYQTFITSDPEVVFSRWHSPYIYLFNGKNISRYCPDNNNFKASFFVSFSCQIASKGKNAVTPQYKNLTDYTADELALISFLLDKKDQVVDSNDVLIKSLENKDEKTPLKYYVQARFCQKNGNFKCAAENWMKSLAINPSSPTAFVGLSLSYLAVEDMSRAQTFYEKAKFLSKGLVDFKKLEYEMLQKN